METGLDSHSEIDDDDDVSINIYDELLNKHNHVKKTLNGRLSTTSTLYSVKGWTKNLNHSYSDWNNFPNGWKTSSDGLNKATKVSL